MKRYKVTGHVDVAVTTIIEVEDGEELTEEEICVRANGEFGGIENFVGFFDCDHMIGVSGDEDTIEAGGVVFFMVCVVELR